MVGRKKKRRTMRVKVQELQQFAVKVLRRSDTSDETCQILVDLLDQMESLFGLPNTYKEYEKPDIARSDELIRKVKHIPDTVLSLESRKRACRKVLGMTS